MKEFLVNASILLLTAFAVSGCQTPNLTDIRDRSVQLLNFDVKSEPKVIISDANQQISTALSLQNILNKSSTSRDLGSSFTSAMISALEKDPLIVSSRLNFEARLAAIDIAESGKEFQVSGSVYGGIEDVTDNTRGVAFVLNASRLVYDGGSLDARISEKSYAAESARKDLEAALNARALKLGEIWIELEKYEKLNLMIESRLAILDPLITQLEEVAKAGIGDVSKVASAQRIVSEIRVAQTRISEGLAQAKLDYESAFGSLPVGISYDSTFIAQLVPKRITEDMVQKSPHIASKYAAYQASLATLRGIQAKEDFSVGFEARASRPFAGSDSDSDESIGLVARKTIFNGNLFDSERKGAEANIKAAVEQIRGAYRESSGTIKTAQQKINSMDKAIDLSRKNAKLTKDEIVYLRQQLVIGGSTLQSVLSAEARLYDAESKEIEFSVVEQKSQLVIVSTLGLLGVSLTFE